MGRQKEEKNYVHEACLWRILSQLPFLDDKNAIFLVQGRCLPHGNFYLLFWGGKAEIRMPFLQLLFFFWVPLSQDNPCAKVTYATLLLPIS